MRSQKPKECRECPLYDRDEVPYRKGLPSFKAMIVGQSPGRDEVFQKRPFIGPSGDLLRRCLNKVGLSRDDFFIANALRCFEGTPALTGKMLDTALACCRPNLTRAMTLMKPKIILGLGGHAVKQLHSKAKITEIRGKFVQPTGLSFQTLFFFTFHPAAVLREAAKEYPNIPFEQMGSREKAFILDLQLFKDAIDNAYKPPTLEVSNYKEGTKTDLTKLLKAKIISFDFETANRTEPERANDVRHPSTYVLSAAFASEEGTAYWFDAQTEFGKKAIRSLLESPSLKLVAARPFDEEVARLLLGVTLQGAKYDVLTMAHVNDENYHRFNLENIAEIYANMRQIKLLAWGKRQDLANLPRTQLIEYNCVDADATLRVGRNIVSYWKKAADTQRLLRYYEKFTVPVQDMLADISQHGCLIDQKRLAENTKLGMEKAGELHKKLISRLPEQIKKDFAKTGKGLMLTRKNLVRAMVFGHLKCIPDRRFITKVTKEPECTVDHLTLFKAKHPWIESYLDWGALNKIVTSYLLNMPQHIKNDGRVYPSTLLTTTVTGRSSIVAPAIQTIPQRSSYAYLSRSMFIPDPGWVMGARDLSQSELRIMGWYSGEKNIINALRKGIDLHNLTASIVNNIPVSKVTPDMRQKAKGVNFGLIYGMLAESLKNYLETEYKIFYTLKECEAIWSKYFQGYPRLQLYYQEQLDFCREFEYVETPLGRRRRLPAIKSEDKRFRLDAERQAINARVQSFSSDLAFIGMLCFHHALKDMKLSQHIRLLFFIHDAIMFQAKEKYMPKAMSLLRECMNERSVEYIKKNFGVTIGYPVESDGKSGPSWEHLVKWKE